MRRFPFRHHALPIAAKESFCKCINGTQSLSESQWRGWTEVCCAARSPLRLQAGLAGARCRHVWLNLESMWLHVPYLQAEV